MKTMNHPPVGTDVISITGALTFVVIKIINFLDQSAISWALTVAVAVTTILYNLIRTYKEIKKPKN